MKATFEAIQDEIASMLEYSDGEMTPDQIAAMDSYLDELSTAEAAKVDGFASFVREELARAEYYKTEAKRLASKAKSAESRIGFLKTRYADIMQQHGLNKVRGNSYSLSLRRTKAVAVTALTDTLPPNFVRKKVEVEPDKKAIKVALESGLHIPGCAIAETVSLQIS